MHTARIILIYIFATVVVIICGGLIGWYFFLHTTQTKNVAVDAARGLESEQISFSGGSTQKNISSSMEAGSSTAPRTQTSALWQVDKTPVAGMGFIKNSSTTPLAYIERANGYVFMVDPAQRTIVRHTDTLIPKIYEALVASDGSIIERSLDESGAITTFLGIAHATTTPSLTAADSIESQHALTGTYMTKDIQTIALNPTTKAMLYTTTNTSGGVDIFSTEWGGAKPKKIFSSNIAHWTPHILQNGNMILTENPADDILGYSYTLLGNGTLSPLIGDVLGLTVLPHPTLKILLYGSSARGVLALFVKKQASSTPITLSIQTVADKCVWLPGNSLIAYCAVPTETPRGDFLNQWYRGAVHTSDTWWKIDVANGTVVQIYSPKKSDGVDVDVEYPIIDPVGNFIFFTNASDKSLWMLKLPQ